MSRRKLVGCEHAMICSTWATGSGGQKARVLSMDVAEAGELLSTVRPLDKSQRVGGPSLVTFPIRILVPTSVGTQWRVTK